MLAVASYEVAVIGGVFAAEDSSAVGIGGAEVGEAGDGAGVDVGSVVDGSGAAGGGVVSVFGLEGVRGLGERSGTGSLHWCIQGSRLGV